MGTMCVSHTNYTELLHGQVHHEHSKVTLKFFFPPQVKVKSSLPALKADNKYVQHLLQKVETVKTVTSSKKTSFLSYRFQNVATILMKSACMIYRVGQN